MDLLLILTYSALCIVIFKVFKVPLNKWTVPTAILGGIGKPYGAVAGGLVIGIAEELSAYPWIGVEPLLNPGYKAGVAFAIMVISARTGATGTHLSKIHAAHSLGATSRQILRKVILPNSLPEILTGIRIAIGVCWGTLVAAEMLAGTTGIGFVENVARKQSDYEIIWTTIIILGLLGLLFDLMMRWVIAKVIPWRGKG